MQRKRTTRRRSSNPDAIHLLDKFSENDVKNWNETHGSFESYWVPVHYHLEGLRRLHHEKIIEALRKSTSSSITLNNWCRIVDYQYSNNPLSARGCIIAGGRFNISSETEDDVLKPISALYCAENYETAFAERFGNYSRKSADTLSGEELALRKTTSFSHVRLSGIVHNLFDLNKTSNLTPFVNIIKNFDIPSELKALAKKLGVRPPYTIDKPSQVKKVFLDPAWRQWIALYDIPVIIPLTHVRYLLYLSLYNM